MEVGIEFESRRLERAFKEILEILLLRGLTEAEISELCQVLSAYTKSNDFEKAKKEGGW
jgi:hypothetical protein